MLQGEVFLSEASNTDSGLGNRCPSMDFINVDDDMLEELGRQTGLRSRSAMRGYC
jgi:hypothetical protein